MKESNRLDHAVFWPPMIIFLGLVVLSLVNEEAFATTVTTAFYWLVGNFGWLMSRREKNPPSTHIVQLLTTPVEDAAQGDAQDLLTMEVTEDGKVTVQRTGLSLGSEETANLVITIQDDHCTIIEKKGLKRRGCIGQPVTGQATLDCLRPGYRYRMRYESHLTSAWATFNFDMASAVPKQVILTY